METGSFAKRERMLVSKGGMSPASDTFSAALTNNQMKTRMKRIMTVNCSTDQ